MAKMATKKAAAIKNKNRCKVMSTVQKLKPKKVPGVTGKKTQWQVSSKMKPVSTLIYVRMSSNGKEVHTWFPEEAVDL